MKLLILAQIPPPLHGQSTMVQTLLDALPLVEPTLELHHVNLPLSRNTADIGQPRLGKLWPILRAAAQVWRLTLRHGRMTLYYVPAPARRATVYRDLLVMFLCRPWAARLVLHWHAAGLGHWLHHGARPWERALTRRALGRAEVSIVLGEALRADVAGLHPLRTVVVPNGIADPCPGWRKPARPNVAPGENRPPLKVLFIGALSREKGLFTALAGVAEAHRRQPGSVRFTVAGNFADDATAAEFRRRARATQVPVDHVGFVTDQAKHELFAYVDVLIFPTRYEHEAHPLVVVEAQAYDLPVIVSSWRAVTENLPPDHSYVLTSDRDAAAEIALALAAIAAAPAPGGAVRRHFLTHYARERFAHAMVEAMR